MSYKVAIVEQKDPIVESEASRSSIKDFFSVLLNETKDFKYQIFVKKNTSSMEKLNLLQFISIQQQKQ